MDIVSEFRAELAVVGIITGDPIIRDWELHIVEMDGDESNSNRGFYSLYPGDDSSGIFGCLPRGILRIWWSGFGQKSFEPRGGLRNVMEKLLQKELDQIELINRANEELMRDPEGNESNPSEIESEFLTFKDIKEAIPDISPSDLDHWVEQELIECKRRGRRLPRLYPKGALRHIEYHHRMKWFTDYESV